MQRMDTRLTAACARVSENSARVGTQLLEKMERLHGEHVDGMEALTQELRSGLLASRSALDEDVGAVRSQVDASTKVRPPPAPPRRVPAWCTDCLSMCSRVPSQCKRSRLTAIPTRRHVRCRPCAPSFSAPPRERTCRSYSSAPRLPRPRSGSSWRRRPVPHVLRVKNRFCVQNRARTVVPCPTAAPSRSPLHCNATPPLLIAVSPRTAYLTRHMLS